MEWSWVKINYAEIAAEYLEKDGSGKVKGMFVVVMMLYLLILCFTRGMCSQLLKPMRKLTKSLISTEYFGHVLRQQQNEARKKRTQKAERGQVGKNTQKMQV